MNQLTQLSSEALLEQGASFVKKTAQAVGQQTQATAQTTVSQLTGMHMTPADGGMQPIQRDQQTADFVKDLYSTSKPQSHPQLPSVSDQPADVQEKQEKAATDQKLADTRQKLSQLLQSQHRSVYYDPTFNRPKPPEEKPVEKLEREKQEELWEKQEKDKKKPPPMAVQMGSNKAERFPGASG